MGLAIRSSLEEVGAFYGRGEFQQAGREIEQAMAQLSAATEKGSAEFYDAVEPMISRVMQARILLVEKGVSLGTFERPTRPAGEPGSSVAVDITADARRIDQLIGAGLSKASLQPLPRASDDVFLRRVYLDLAGRIPSYDEAETFLNDTRPTKRAELIDSLLASPAYVSHYLNFWSDILRVQTQTKNTPGALYHDWVRKALMANTPYDQLVRELITARGYLWENGAAGFYIRDKNMPLDHMANTAQVFLGTQLQCAQCHDHPFDVWTQMDFYRMAAYTYGIETDQKPLSAKKLAGEYRDRMDLADRNAMYGLIKDYTTPLSSRSRFEPEVVLKLPEDYQYDDADPFDPVRPGTPFGDDAPVEAGTDPSLAYAEWMTSPENPRFTIVVANRLWEKVMGAGLMPVADDLSVGTPSDPDLLRFLEGRMKAYGYDLKQYLRLIVNTEAYQRDAFPEELVPGEPYRFQGPVFRRMTAEQAWDSLVTLVVPDVDGRYQSGVLRERFQVAPAMVGRSKEALLPAFLEQRDRRPLLNRMEELQHDLYRARIGKGKRSGPEKIKEVEAKIAALQKEIDAVPGLTRFLEEGGEGNTDPMDLALVELRHSAQGDPRYAPFPTGLRRASELPQPAEDGHFLREFGQSDRELIENAASTASITQILALLNGPAFGNALDRKAVLMSRLEAVEGPEDKIQVIYLSLLTRPPSGEELAICRAEVRAHGDRAYPDIIWALLNTRQFTFIN